jgi:hypothetical protein
MRRRLHLPAESICRGSPEMAERRWAPRPFRFPVRDQNPNETKTGIASGFSIPVSA